MKFIKYLKFDIYQGIFHNLILMISPVIIGAVIFVDFIVKADRFLAYDIIDEFVSYGDYLFFLYGGMKEYIPEYGKGLLLPIVWIIVFFVLPFILLNYPLKDMSGHGQHILTRSTKRIYWWLSKCLWNILGTILFHFIILITGLVLCYIFQVEISNRIHMDFVKTVFDASHEEIKDVSVLMMSAVIVPICVSASINMLQMMLSLFIKPIYSFFCVVILLLASIYLLSPGVLGNYAMVFRHNWVLDNGVSLEAGYFMSVMLLIVATIVGCVRFRYYDILGDT